MEGAEGDAGEAFARGHGALDPARLAAHRGRRKILRARRAATSLRPEGDEKAARRLR
jgi:hypothetical protein